MGNSKWSKRFLAVAGYISRWGQAPHQRGCVLTQERRIVSLGFTGLPSGIDLPDLRSEEYVAMLVSAEENAILYSDERLHGASAYLHGRPTAQGTSLLIQAGVKDIRTTRMPESHTADKAKDLGRALEMMREANVNYEEVDINDYAYPIASLNLLKHAEDFAKADSDSLGRRLKWDARYMGLAFIIGEWSKDPSTKVGAVLADKFKRYIGSGYNGFPKYLQDREELYNDRPEKYARVIHAEKNAILYSQRHRMADATAYVTVCPCASCASFLAASGIHRVVTMSYSAAEMERWRRSFEISSDLFNRKHMILEFINPATTGSYNRLDDIRTFASPADTPYEM